MLAAKPAKKPSVPKVSELMPNARLIMPKKEEKSPPKVSANNSLSPPNNKKESSTIETRNSKLSRLNV